MVPLKTGYFGCSANVLVQCTPWAHTIDSPLVTLTNSTSTVQHFNKNWTNLCAKHFSNSIVYLECKFSDFKLKRLIHCSSILFCGAGWWSYALTDRSSNIPGRAWLTGRPTQHRRPLICAPELHDKARGRTMINWLTVIEYEWNNYREKLVRSSALLRDCNLCFFCFFVSVSYFPPFLFIFSVLLLPFFLYLLCISSAMYTHAYTLYHVTKRIQIVCDAQTLTICMAMYSYLFIQSTKNIHKHISSQICLNTILTSPTYTT